MAFIQHVLLILGIGIFFSIASHLHWQTARQLMPATGAIGLVAAYTFAYVSNNGSSWIYAGMIAIFTGALIGGLLVSVARHLTRSEFLLLGLALGEVVRRIAFEWDTITRGAYGLILQSTPLRPVALLSWSSIGFASIALGSLAIWWASPRGLTWRLAGGAPRCASLMGINVRAPLWFGAVLAGAIASLGGVFYCMSIRYVHPDDLGLRMGLPALAAGLAARPNHLFRDALILGVLLFALRELLRYWGTGPERFAWHDVIVGVFIIVISIRLGQRSDQTEAE